MAKVSSLLEAHDQRLNRLTEKDQKRDDRNKAVVKWLSGIAATVIAALALVLFKR